MALNDGRVVSNFIVQALKGEDITVFETVCKTCPSVSSMIWLKA
jgi:hypothetical protein